MNTEDTNWEEEENLPPPTPEEETQALVNAIRRSRGFRLLFVQCSPQAGQEVIQNVTEELPQKKIATLSLDKAIDKLYPLLEAYQDQEVLFIRGLEQSLLAYETEKRDQGWNTEEIYSYNWHGVPRILNHLNQQREQFRDNFPLCFVFLLPRFAIDYFIHRCPDFYDWRSGSFQISSDDTGLRDTSSDLYNWEWALSLNLQERQQEILNIQSQLKHQSLLLPERASLSNQKAILLHIERRYSEAIASYDKALEIKPDYHEAWNNRGIAFYYLQRYSEAIASYDKALEIKPDDHEAWNNRGIAFYYLQRYSEAIASYDKALEIKPERHETWYNRGYALGNLQRYSEAISSYDKALEIKPDYHVAWNNRGLALGDLQRYSEAISSYNKALEIKPDYHVAWNNRGLALGNLQRYSEAIASYNKALEIKPDYPKALYNKACCYALQGKIDLAIQNLNKAIQLNPKECIKMAKNDSDFDNIRADVRFQKLFEEDC